MSQESENSKPAILEERMEDMFTQLSLTIKDLADRINGRDWIRNNSLSRHRLTQEGIESCGDN